MEGEPTNQFFFFFNVGLTEHKMSSLSWSDTSAVASHHHNINNDNNNNNTHTPSTTSCQVPLEPNSTNQFTYETLCQLSTRNCQWSR